MQDAGVDGVEMALLANLMPENAEEAYALVPSLKVGAVGGISRRRGSRGRTKLWFWGVGVGGRERSQD